MDELIKNVEEVRRLAESQSEDNYRFRSFLKSRLNWSDRRLDSVVHEIVRVVASGIDCTTCSNCCRTMTVSVDNEDIERLAHRLCISVEEFENNYVSRNDWSEKTIEQTPCPFLDGALCSVYDDRPRDCREFPHLDKQDVRSRSIGLIENASYCPIVFNTLQLLKQRLGWR